LQVLNLFLALLLSSFGGGSLSSKSNEEEPNKIGEAVGRIVRFFRYMRKHSRRMLRQCGRKGVSFDTGLDLAKLHNGMCNNHKLSPSIASTFRKALAALC